MTRSGGVLLGIAVLVLALVPAAMAGPVKSGVYTSPFGRAVSLNVTVAKSGKKIDTFFLEVPTSCRIGKVRPHYPTTFSPTPDMVIKRGGSFGYTEVIRGPRPGAIAKWKVTGRFAPGGRSVSVTGRYTLKRPDGGCDTKTRKVTAPLENLSSPGPFSGPWAGRTAAGEPITFNVENGRVTDLKSRATLKCDDGTTVTRDVHFDQVKSDGSGFDNDSVTGTFDDQFSVEGALTPSERMPPTADDPDPGMCLARDAFTATPARPLDS